MKVTDREQEILDYALNSYLESTQSLPGKHTVKEIESLIMKIDEDDGE